MPYVLIKLMLLAHTFGGIAVWNHSEDPVQTVMLTQQCDWVMGMPGDTGYDLCIRRGQ